jgi:hypothetical protein
MQEGFFFEEPPSVKCHRVLIFLKKKGRWAKAIILLMFNVMKIATRQPCLRLRFHGCAHPVNIRTMLSSCLTLYLRLNCTKCLGWVNDEAVCCIAAKLAVTREAEQAFWLLQYPSVLHVMLLFCDRFQSWMSSPGEPPPHFFVSSFPLMSYTAYKWAEKLFFFVSRFIYWNAE